MDESGFKLGLAQMEASVGDTDGNVKRGATLVGEAAAEGADMVVLPEFFNTGYFPLYWNYDLMALAEPESGSTVSTFRKVARDNGVYVVVPFYEIDSPGTYYDTAVIVAPSGETVAKYRKTHPPARISVEKLYYRAASRLPVFDVLGWRVGLLICYDNYLTEPARALMARGAELIIAPFAEVAGFDMWSPLLRTRAFENGLYVAACNLVGPDSDEPKQIMGGRSLLIDPEGALLGEGAPDAGGTVIGDVDREHLVAVRAKRQFRRDRRPELYGVLTEWDEDARELAN